MASEGPMTCSGQPRCSLRALLSDGQGGPRYELSSRQGFRTTLHAPSVVRTEGNDSSVNVSRDTGQPTRVGIGTRLGSTHRVGGTRHSESVSQLDQWSRLVMGERGPDDMLRTTSMCTSGLLSDEQGGPRHERRQRRVPTPRGPSQARNLLRLAYYGQKVRAWDGHASLTCTGEAKPPGISQHQPSPSKEVLLPERYKLTSRAVGRRLGSNEPN